MITLLLMVLAVILLGLSTFGVPSKPSFNLLAGGLTAWALAQLILMLGTHAHL